MTRRALAVVLRPLAALVAVASLLAPAQPARASEPLPYRRLVRAQETLAPGNPSNLPAYERPANHVAVPVQPADTSLAEWAVKPGPGVREIHAEVGGDPNAAYRWVRDKVEYVPYFGSKNGAEGTAWERTGNDFDQATLLASLLRLQGVPVRFVYGVVRVTAADLADWCGMARAEEAVAFLSQGGVPLSVATTGAVISHVDMNHVWLEARVPYASPGHQGVGEAAWVPLDPSFKLHSVEQAQDLFPLLASPDAADESLAGGFQLENFLLDYLRTPEEQSPEDYFRELLHGKLAELGGTTPLSGAALRVAIVPGGEGALPTTMPPEVEVRGMIWELPYVPEIYQYRIRVTLLDGLDDGAGVAAGDVRLEIPVPFFAHHSLALLYQPATPEDEALAEGSPTRSPLDPSVRDRIRLRPALLADGRPIGELFAGDFLVAGVPENPERVGNIGLKQKLRTETIPPRKTAETVAYSIDAEGELVVGGAYALGAMAGVITAERMAADGEKLRALQERGSASEILAQTLSLAALQYLHKSTVSDRAFAAFLGVRHFQEPSLLLCGIAPSEWGYDVQKVFFDVEQYIQALVSIDGRADRERAFMFLAGLQSSWYEHEVLATVFRTQAVSAVRILKRAQALGTTPYVLDKTSPDLQATLEGMFGVEGAADLLDRLMGQDEKLLVHPGVMTLEGWSGRGYIVWSPESGAGGYIISGGLAGGNVSGTAPQFLLTLYQHRDANGKIFTVVMSWWYDQDAKQGYVDVVLVDLESISGPYVASVVILPDGFELPDTITIEYWKFLAPFATSFYADEGDLRLEAYGICLFPDDAENLHPCFLKPPGVSGGGYLNPVSVESVAWSVIRPTDATGGELGSVSGNPVTYDGPPAADGTTVQVQVTTSAGETLKALVKLVKVDALDETLIEDLDASLDAAAWESQREFAEGEAAKVRFWIDAESTVTVSLVDAGGAVVETMLPGALMGIADNPITLDLPTSTAGRYTVVAKAVDTTAGTLDVDDISVTVTGSCAGGYIVDPAALVPSPNPTFYPVGTEIPFVIPGAFPSTRVALRDVDLGDALPVVLKRPNGEKVTDLSAVPPGEYLLFWDGSVSGQYPLGDRSLLLELTASSCFQQVPLAVTLDDPDRHTDSFIIEAFANPVAVPERGQTTVSFRLAAGTARGRIMFRRGEGTEEVLPLGAQEAGTTLSHLVSLPAGAGVGPAYLDLEVYTAASPPEWDRRSIPIVVVSSSAGSPATPELLDYYYDVAGAAVVWPAAEVLWAGTIDSAASINAIVVEARNVDDEVVGTRLYTPADGARLSATSPAWVVGTLPGIAEPPAGQYTSKITAVSNTYGKVWYAEKIVEVLDSVAYEPLFGFGPGVEAPIVLAPWRTIEGLGEPAALPLTVSGSDVTLAIIPTINGVVTPLRQPELVAPSGDFPWQWDGEVLLPASGDFGPTTGGSGTLTILARNSYGDYTLREETVIVDTSRSSVAAVSDVTFDPWVLRIEPAYGYVGGVRPYVPVTVNFQVNVPGRLTLVVVDDAGADVRTLFADTSVGIGPAQCDWDGKDAAGKVVEEGSYHLRAELVPLQDSFGSTLEVEDSFTTVRVLFDARKVAELGKKRGKAFYGGIDVTSGNNFLEVDDISVPVNRFGFTWTRYYNSRDGIQGTMGVGWRHRYDVRLLPADGGSRQLVWGHGGGELFVKDSSSYTTPSGSLNSLSASGDGWRLETPDGTFVFDGDGFVTSGWGLSFDYEVVDGNKRLRSISGSGISASVDYNSNGFVSDVSAGGYTVSYSYDAKAANDVNSDDKGYYLDGCSNRFGSYSYSYGRVVRSTGDFLDRSGVKRTGDSLHYAMSSSSGPLEGHTSYGYETTEERIQGGTGSLARYYYLRSPRATSVNHSGGRGWSGRGLTSYSYGGSSVTIGNALGTEVVSYNATEMTVRSRKNPRDFTTTMTWDSKRRLEWSTDGAAVTTHRTYRAGTDWVLTEDTAGLGRRTYGHDGEGAVTSETDQLGHTTGYHYDYGYALNLGRSDVSGKGTRITVTHPGPEGYTTTRYLDADGRLVREVDPLDHVWDMGYNDRGQMTWRKDPRLHVTTYTYDAWDRVKTESVAFTHRDGTPGVWTTTYGYDGAGNRTSATDAAGNTTTYVYDGGNRLVQEVDRFGKVVREHQRRSDTGWIAASWDLHRAKTEFAYLDNGWVASETRRPGDGTVLVTQHLDYDDRGNLLVKRDPPAYEGDVRSHDWTYAYDAANRMVRATDPTLRATERDYFDDGDLAAEFAIVSGARALRAVYETNEAGWVLGEGRPFRTEAEVLWTGYEYDDRGNRTGSFDPVGNPTTYVYDTYNLLRQEVDPFGQVQRAMTYNADGLPKTEKDYHGRTTRYAYNANHLPSFMWDPHHVRTSFAYDDLGRRTGEERAGLPVTYGYDGGGNRASVTDGEGHVRASIYDEANRLLTEYVRLAAGSAYVADAGLPESGKILRALTYDARGRVKTETDAEGYTVTYSYYLNDWVKRRTLSDGSWEQFQYAPTAAKIESLRTNGLWQAADGETANVLATVYDLDAARQLRVETIHYPDGRTEAFTYTPGNDVRSHTDRDGVTDWFAYDDPDQPHRATRQWRQTTSALEPVDCRIETVAVAPPSAARGILLSWKDYNAAGDVVAEANSSQVARGLQVGYHYTGDPGDANSTIMVLLDLKQDRAGPSDPVRNRRFTYHPGTDRVHRESVDLPAGSGYEGRPGALSDPTQLLLAEYQYDLAGNVRSVRDGDDRVTELAYDELNRKSAEWRYREGGAPSDANRTRAWTYDGRGNVASESLYGINDGAAVATTTHQHADPRGGKTRTDHPGGAYEEWAYDKAGNQVRHGDPDGRVVVSTFDAFDRPELTIQAVPAGSPYLGKGFAEAPTGEPAPLATGIVVAANAYGAAGDLEAQTDGRGTVTRYLYADGYHRPTEKRVEGWEHRLADGSVVTEDAVWRYVYDALGKPAVTTEPGDLQSLAEPVDADIPAARVTVVQYDAEGRELKSLRLLSGPSGYAATGTLYARTGFAGYTGLLFAQASYDAVGRKVGEVDGRGIASTAAFDVLDRVQQQSRAGVVTARFRYEAGGNKLWTLGAVAGYDRTFEYDDFGHPTVERGYPGKDYNAAAPLANAVAVRTAHADRQGNVLWEQDAGSPDPNRVEYAYDLRGRRIEQRVITGETPVPTTGYAYDGIGNKTAETTPRGTATATAGDYTTTWAYDAFNRVSGVTAPDGGFTSYEYDPNGNLLRIEDAEYGPSDSDASGGHFSTFTYDRLNNRTASARDAGGGRVIDETAGYDGGGTLLWKRDGAGRQVGYENDEFGRARLEVRGLPASPAAGIEYLVEIEYAYDGNGNAVTTTESLEDAGHATRDRVVNRVFDDFNRMTTETADGRAAGWVYDNDGRRASVTYADGRALAYTYDGLGNLARMSDSAKAKNTVYTRYANGLVDVIAHPNDATEDWGYKPGTKEAATLVVSDAAAQVLRSATYQYDADGNRIAETDARRGQADIVRASHYDVAGRLWKVEEGNPVTRTTEYAYDRLGNRTGETVSGTGPATSLTAAFNGAGEVTAIDGTKEGVAGYEARFTYDAAGNLTDRTESGKPARGMAYDVAGKLVAVRDGGAPAGLYRYNAEGRRVEVEVGSICRAYAYDGRSLLEELPIGCTDHALGPVERRYLYADRLLALGTSGGEYAVHLDPLGSTLEVTDAAGASFNSNAYDPWGEVETTRDGAPVATVSKLLYTGHQHDEATGLIYFGARYYDPALARFLSADPYFGELTTPPSLNKYLYAYANPYVFVDLEGYFVETVSQFAWGPREHKVELRLDSADAAIRDNKDKAGWLKRFVQLLWREPKKVAVDVVKDEAVRFGERKLLGQPIEPDKGNHLVHALKKLAPWETGADRLDELEKEGDSKFKKVLIEIKKEAGASKEEVEESEKTGVFVLSESEAARFHERAREVEIDGQETHYEYFTDPANPVRKVPGQTYWEVLRYQLSLDKVEATWREGDGRGYRNEVGDMVRKRREEKIRQFETQFDLIQEDE